MAAEPTPEAATVAPKPQVVVAGEEIEWPPLWAPRAANETWHADWRVRVDAHTKALDAKFDGTSTHQASRVRPKVIDTSRLPADFGLGVVFGGSGTGKSSLLQELEQRYKSKASAAEVARKSAKNAKKATLLKFMKTPAPADKEEGPPKGFRFPKGMAICSHPALGGDSIDRLSCVGLNRITTWLKPPSVVSEGEKMRASSGMTLRSGAVLDDFAAVVDDRNAASMATSLAKFIEKRDFRCVLVGTTKKSVLPFLSADFVVFADTGVVVLNPWPAAKRRPIIKIESQVDKFQIGPGGGWLGPMDAADNLRPIVDPGAGQRSPKPLPGATEARVLACEVNYDAFCREVAQAFDYEFSGQVEQKIFELQPAVLDEVLGSSWKLAAVVGPSGTGKSYNIRRLIGEGICKDSAGELTWERGLSLVSQLHPDPAESVKLVTAAGLPARTALRPFHVLSRGERDRGEIARRLGLGVQAAAARGRSNADPVCVCLDEFTSVLDRSTARAVCHGIARYMRETRLPLRLVVATVHYDILPWLLADWVLDSATGEVTAFDGEVPTVADVEAVHKRAPLKKSLSETDGSNAEEVRELLKPPVMNFCLQRLENSKRSREIYDEVFEEHHYLKGQTPTAFHGLLLREATTRHPVAFHAIAILVNGHVGNNTFRESRMVVLPEAQGFGIGPRMSDRVGQLLIDSGCRFLSRTAHPRLGAYREANPQLWRAQASNKKVVTGTMSSSIKRPRKDDGEEEIVQAPPPVPVANAFEALLRGAEEVKKAKAKKAESMIPEWLQRCCFAHEYIGTKPAADPSTPNTKSTVLGPTPVKRAREAEAEAVGSEEGDTTRRRLQNFFSK